MHFYWRVKEELRYLGEVLIFRDPTLLREYRRWLRRNRAVLVYTTSEGMSRTTQPCHGRGIRMSPN
jgi:hypothetical protein